MGKTFKNFLYNLEERLLVKASLMEDQSGVDPLIRWTLRARHWKQSAVFYMSIIVCMRIHIFPAWYTQPLSTATVQQLYTGYDDYVTPG
jgi:hypothetical protein